MHLKPWIAFLVLLLSLWAMRITALETLPLHNDEGLHLTRAVEVWKGHPFWNISDGKIINHWLIALFNPQHAPVFTGRIATLMVSMIGLSAAFALAQRQFGPWAALLAGALWIGSPYLFFYERLALSDAEAGALVVLTALCSLRLASSGRSRDALWTGGALAAATLFKFTAAPFALMVTLIVLLLGEHSLQRKIMNLLLVALVTVACFVPPLAYLVLRGNDFFSIALEWIGVSSGQGDPAFAANITRLWAQLTGYGTLGWTALLLGGLIALTILSHKGRILLLASGMPLLVMLVLGREVLPRHTVVVLPMMLTLAGAGLGLLVLRLDQSRQSGIASASVVTVLILGLFPFMQTAYADPALLPLPREDYSQFIIDHSGGFGLREAVQAFPVVIEKDIPLIASMFPDSCRRANFYTLDGGLSMICTDAPGQSKIEAALAEYGAVYVLVDDAPRIGVDVNGLDAQAVQIAAYPRPGEDESRASVVLWLLNER